jgi:uncharacterized protein YjdB/flagellar basal body-associated protein FliL
MGMALDEKDTGLPLTDFSLESAQPEEPEEPEVPEELDEDDALDLSQEDDLEDFEDLDEPQILKTLDQPEPEPEEPEDEDVTMIFDSDEVQSQAQKRQEKAKKETLKKVPTKAQKAAGNQKSAGAKKKKKKKKKGNNAAIVGVLIGLIVALLLIAGGVTVMLYQMGFFDTMTDEELLGTTNQTAVTETATPEPTEEVTQEPEPTEEVEEVPEETEEPTNVPEETDEQTIELDKFLVTGNSTIYFYSRGSTDSAVYVIEPASAEAYIEWSSSDDTVATVDENGTIRARRRGDCTIYGDCGGSVISVSVHCEFDVPDTVLDMNMEDITLNYEGQTVDLAIDYDLTQEQLDAVVWESSVENVATVDDEGHVTAVSSGTAIITASIGDYTASCIVRCVDVTGNKGYNSGESEYAINYEDVTLTRKGEYFELSLKSVLGNEVPDFTWKSDDTSVATVDSKGVVTAVSDGTAYITTTVGSDKFRCIVRVNISD